MPKPTDIHPKSASVATEYICYRTPIKFGGRVVTEAVLLNVTLEVETRDGRRGVGFGSMPMGNAWAWPSGRLSGTETLKAMRTLGERMASQAGEYLEFGHPLEIGHALVGKLQAEADEVIASLGLAEPMPRLAQLVAYSPTDAALHDAYGKALQANSYNLLGPEFANRDLSAYLSPEFQGEYLDRYTLRAPKESLPLYHLVGALDPLEASDVREPVGDGLPEHLGQWIAADGLTHLKLKLSGEDLKWDIERTLAVEHVAAAAQSARGCTQWFYSADFNEKCADVEYVLDYLAAVRSRAPEAYNRLQYIEQPTHRDLRSTSAARMHRAAQLKPVVIDESLVDFESLLLSRELGYSGVALKTCKGHGEALLMAAAAQKFGLFLCVQDLTCPGASFLHSAGLAARIPSVVAVEGNARQYCPAGNHGWAEQYPTMFRITNGRVGTGVLNGIGLGH